jgi:hypothetical protein
VALPEPCAGQHEQGIIVALAPLGDGLGCSVGKLVGLSHDESVEGEVPVEWEEPGSAVYRHIGEEELGRWLRGIGGRRQASQNLQEDLHPLSPGLRNLFENEGELGWKRFLSTNLSTG